MAYNKTVWVDDSTPAINAANLNNIENGIEQLDLDLTTANSDIATLQTDVTTNTTAITTNATNHTALLDSLDDAVIRRVGTFTGVWNPTLSATYGITNYTDYWWTVSLNQPSLTLQNGHTIVLDGYLDVDDNTLRFTSTDNSVGVQADYLLVGIKKTMSNFATVNQ